MTLDLKPSFSCTASLLQTTLPYTLVEENDGWGTKTAKYTLGTVAHALQAVIALVEFVVAAALLILVKVGQFFIPKEYSTWVDTKMLEPLAARAFEANVSLLLTASLIVTNFMGPAIILKTTNAIEETLSDIYSSNIVQTIKHLHINGLSSEQDTTQPLEETGTASSAAQTTPAEDLACFFDRLPILKDKPTFQGDPATRAEDIQQWMETHPAALAEITEVDLTNAGLGSLPPAIGKLTGLRELNLSGNNLTSLPPELWNLTGLQRLYLEKNLLSSLPSQTGIGRLIQLRELNLNGNRLTSLPPAIGSLPFLTQLSAKNNQLESVPKEIGNPLSRLTSLFLGGNQLTSLPAEMGELRTLTLLDLKNNKLPSLPPEFSKLRSLQECYLQGNPINPSALQATLSMRRFGQIFHFGAAE